jgi:hypothetical protein
MSPAEINMDRRIADLENLLREVLGRDGCRCDTSVCDWCNTNGWVYVSPDTIEKIRAILPKRRARDSQ